jgi:hypothetical protein
MARLPGHGRRRRPMLDGTPLVCRRRARPFNLILQSQAEHAQRFDELCVAIGGRSVQLDTRVPKQARADLRAAFRRSGRRRLLLRPRSARQDRKRARRTRPRRRSFRPRRRGRFQPRRADNWARACASASAVVIVSAVPAPIPSTRAALRLRPTASTVSSAPVAMTCSSRSTRP